ncbi:hypothetical protein AAHA92_16018 [Salvia divinorum]|uniref:Retrotransposon protein n=1 Tax=Salvia divinorum TaxID=28513 RepID=A0ABD1GU64_SALDI
MILGGRVHPQASNGLGRSSRQRSVDRHRRVWSRREEEILMSTLKDLVALGWKSDNGFQSGYLGKVEEALQREFPSSDLKLWEQIIRVDNNAHFIRNRPWPLWEDWKEIFGKDRASGPVLKTCPKLRSGPDCIRICRGNPKGGGAWYPVTCKKTKRAKITTHIGGMVELLKQIHDDSNTCLEKLSMRIEYEVDLSKARKEAYEVLGTIDGLSMVDKFDIGEILVANPPRHDFFMGMPPMAHPAYALRVLAE